MSRKKKQSVESAKTVLFSVLAGDVQPLKFFENKLAQDSGRSSVDVPDAEILRHSLHRAFDAEKKSMNKDQIEKILKGKR